MSRVEILIGNAVDQLRTVADGSAKMCVTSPPYWGGLRNYDHPDQIGMEREPADYVDALVAVFSELRRTLSDDGSLWLNIADAYAASGKGGGGNRGDRKAWSTIARRTGFRTAPRGYKPKDLVLASFMVADALRSDGWYLRKTIIWRKLTAIEPERLDRPSLSHEYLFLFSKSEQCAVRNPGERWWHSSVWDIAAQGHPDHPAAFPIELARRAIVAGSAAGDVVIDPFGGSGTTAIAALQVDRLPLLIELNEGFAADIRARVTEFQRQGSLFTEQAA